MRILYCTQSDSLNVFYHLHGALERLGITDTAGFLVSDSRIYSQWLAQTPDFENAGYHLLKEWDITARRDRTPDLNKLSEYEQELMNAAGLFGAVVTDRRLFMGKDCTYTQDYRRRFSDKQLLSILQTALEELEQLFNSLQPDMVVGFICVTILDYLAYLFAKSRGIPFYNLRPTRVGDRVTFGTTLNDPSPALANAYARICRSRTSPFLHDAQAYIERVRTKDGRYEGVVNPSDKPALKVSGKNLLRLPAIVKWSKEYMRYRRGLARHDNHVPDPLRSALYAVAINPWRARQIGKRLKDRYVRGEMLSSLNYVFFPLHTEPEVSLLVYGRPFVNQIEVIRWIAMSLPLDAVLVVKEHPWMVGKRSWGAYRKILNIPRVHLADPRLTVRDLIKEYESSRSHYRLSCLGVRDLGGSSDHFRRLSL